MAIPKARVEEEEDLAVVVGAVVPLESPLVPLEELDEDAFGAAV